MKKIIELDQYETFQPYVAEVKPLTPEQLQIEYNFPNCIAHPSSYSTLFFFGRPLFFFGAF